MNLERKKYCALFLSNFIFYFLFYEYDILYNMYLFSTAGSLYLLLAKVFSFQSFMFFIYFK